MEAAGALRAAAPILESIPNSPGGAGWSWVGCGCHKVPISDQTAVSFDGLFVCLNGPQILDPVVGRPLVGFSLKPKGLACL